MLLCLKGRESGQMWTEWTPDILIFRGGIDPSAKWQNKILFPFPFFPVAGGLIPRQNRKINPFPFPFFPCQGINSPAK